MDIMNGAVISNQIRQPFNFERIKKMAEVFRVDITKQNCWKCDHFRRNDGADHNPNAGTCCARAPRATGAVTVPGAGPDGTLQDEVNAVIMIPENIFCGDFKPWTGPARVVIPVVE
jgi:hypothetical protein